MPTLDRTALLKHLDDVLDEDDVVALLFDLHLDRAKLWPRKVSKYECLINVIEDYERRGQYPALVPAVADFLARQELPPLHSADPLTTAHQPPTTIHHNLPRRNPNFTGRADLLTALEQFLAPGPQPLAPVVLHGLGGIGKTQLALEYAHRRLAGYDLVAWLRAEDAVTLAADLAALAVPLALPQANDPDQTLVVAAVLRWLDGHSRWLLVYDNAADRDTVKPYLPQAGAGHTLITSRHRGWAGVAHALDVPVLPRPDAIAFLLARTGQSHGTAADKLADALGDLPLALEQAAAYIDDAGLSLAAYLARFETRRADLLRRGRAATGYPDTVWTTWDLSIQAARQANPASADLLTLCAFFAPDDIPVSVIRQGAAHLPDPLAAAGRDDLAFDEVVAPLRRLSLLDRADDSLAVHRLVQSVARDHLPTEDIARYAATVLRLLAAGIPQGDTQTDLSTWPLCARLLPHIIAASPHAVYAPAEAVHAINQVTDYLLTRAQYAVSRPLLEQAVSVAEQYLPPNAPLTATALHDLASVLHDQGDLSAARAYKERALAIREQVLGPDHPDTATSLNNLARVLHDQGDLPAARALHERALAIWEKALGPDHPSTATSIAWLGTIAYAQGDLPAARALYERALAIYEKALGPDHPDTAQSLNNLAGVLHDQGDLPAARALCERALAIREKVLGPDHPDTATSLNNLAVVLEAQGNLAAARPLYERAIRIAEKALGQDHPDTQLYRRNLAYLNRRR